MQLHITTNEGVPIYLQIVNQVKYLVASGRLSSGDELPPIRSLAEQLVVNPNTVARAYRELEQSGVVEKRRTAGTYISAAGSPLARGEQVRILSLRLDSLLSEANQMGFSIEQVVELLRIRAANLIPDPSNSMRSDPNEDLNR
jgi:GntR family transcriptional regulator